MAAENCEGNSHPRCCRLPPAQSHVRVHKLPAATIDIQQGTQHRWAHHGPVSQGAWHSHRAPLHRAAVATTGFGLIVAVVRPEHEVNFLLARAAWRNCRAAASMPKFATARYPPARTATGSRISRTLNAKCSPAIRHDWLDTVIAHAQCAKIPGITRGKLRKQMQQHDRIDAGH